MIYVDSNVLIYALEDATPRGDAIRRRFVEMGGQLAYSPLVRMECRVKPLRDEHSLTLRRFDRVFAEMKLFDIPPAVYDLAATARATHQLKAMDAIHLATAQFHLCTGFWTHDDRLRAAAGGLAIETF
ncbi:type II toxin-antitoxin system VapC family toxin [Herbiconiux sp. 11R-BC]|uniref:type II toxin-antitoxin system VapC family toxin n=1 Tax=Herbiconiux sp. 11R-BC TaxID=3111637 RepID=UPI003C11E69F